MSESFSKVEIITGIARRRRFTAEQKMAIIAETMQPGVSMSYVARRHGLSPSLVFRWKSLMSQGGREAVRADDDVVPASEARRLEEKVRELERLLGRKTIEVEILKEALDLARSKNRPCGRPLRCRTVPDKSGRQHAWRRPVECCGPAEGRSAEKGTSGPGRRYRVGRRNPALR